MKRNKIYEHFLTALRFMRFLLTAKHRYGHGVHSPFVFELISKVINDKKKYPEYVFLNDIRSQLKVTDDQLKVKEIGSGSARFSTKLRSVSEMIRISSVNRKSGELLFRVSRHYKPDFIVELGTSIGMGSIYLSKGSPKSKLITIEGNQGLVQFANELFLKYPGLNIQTIYGLFDQQLVRIKENYPAPGIVFIDGNHNYEPTLKYFRFFSNYMTAGILIFDDINWSAAMNKAWSEIIKDSKANVTIDLFYMGIVVLDKGVTPGHYNVRF
jgi:predicted O-methyltransferase YrrM